MLQRSTITVKDASIFLYMLENEKNVDDNVELVLDCNEYSSSLSANIASSIIAAMATKRHYSKIRINLNNSYYNVNIQDILNTLGSGTCQNGLTIDLSDFQPRNINQLKLIKDITTSLMGNSPENLTIILNNCNLRDSEILLIAKGISSGKYPSRLDLQFNSNNNIRSSYYNKITNDGARAIIAAIKSEKCPFNFQINLEDNLIDDELLATIDSLLEENNKKYDRLACVTLQQGVTQKKSVVKNMPDVIASKIYEYVIPLPGTSSTSFFKALKKITKAKNIDDHEPHGCCMIL